MGGRTETIEVRDVGPDREADWNNALDTAFMRRRDPAEVSAHRARHPDPPTMPQRRRGAFMDGRLVGTTLTFATGFSLPGGGELAVDAVSSVGVLPTHRRRGVLSALMAPTLAEAAERGAAASVLIAAEYPIYGRFGYGPASEAAVWEVDARAVFRRAPSSGSVQLVEPAELRAPAEALFQELRTQRPANIERRDVTWDQLLGLDTTPGHPPWTGRCVTYTEADGRLTGYACYHLDADFDGRRANATLHLDDLVTTTAEAYEALWRYCCEVDWVRRVRAGDRPTDDLIAHLLLDARLARQVERDDFLWLRVLDPLALLKGRAYLSPRHLVLEVVDPAGYANGRFELHDGTCRRTTRSADLTLPVEALGAVVLGGTPLRALADAGWLSEERPGASDEAAAHFHWPVAPWCATWF